MKQVVQDYKTGELRVEEVPVPFLKPGGILVKNRYSLVSPGTERSMTELAQKNIIGKVRARPDLLKQAIDKAKRDGIVETITTVMNRLDVTKPLGYSSAGIVMEVGDGVDGFQPNDRVACAGAGYASHAEVVFVPKNLCARVPEAVSLEDAACATFGAVALHGVRIANPLLGEKVAVIGLGLLGQITVQLLRLSGCEALGIDPDPDRVDTALKLGMKLGVTETDDAEKAANAISKGHGMDAIIITATTASSSPIGLAAKISRDRGRVVVVGNVGLDVPREIFYKKELEMCLSRSYGPGRYDPIYEEKGVDYPFGYVRWTEKRNMEAFMGFIAQGRLNLRPLITHCFPVEEAGTVYELLNETISINDHKVVKYKRPLASGEDRSEAGNRFLGVLIEYKDEPGIKRRFQIAGAPLYHPQSSIADSRLMPGRQSLNIGLIGAGNFVKAILLPILKDIKPLRLKGLATATGINAKVYARRHAFEYCTTDYNEILNDKEIDTVIIATRHDLHARLVIEALQHGKDVFVEKPLAISEDGLNKIVEVWQERHGRLMVGFNRRFSPFTVGVKEFFKDRKGPLVMNYRINAGAIPKDSWVNDLTEGGGRIIGEVCHFVDLLQFLAGAQPVKVYAEVVTGDSGLPDDNVNINLKFRDGSIGSIVYASCGDRMFSKERIEVFGDGMAAVIDDFRSASLVKDGKTKKIKTYRQDKGHRREMELFFSAITEGKDSPIPFGEGVMATLVTFKIIESIRKGSHVWIDDLLIHTKTQRHKESGFTP